MRLLGRDVHIDVGHCVLEVEFRRLASFNNGEVGVVTAAKDGSLIVEFGAGPVTVPPRALIDLTHGWAITVHRAQGSEWTAVVSVLVTMPGRNSGENADIA